jgi:hypothetical protein
MGEVLKLPNCPELSPELLRSIASRAKNASCWAQYWSTYWSLLQILVRDMDPEEVGQGALDDVWLRVLGWLYDRNRAAIYSAGVLKAYMENSEGDADRRRRGDRRSQSRPGVKFFLLGGRRKSARRDNDKKQFIYVDQYRPWLLVAIMLLAILSLSDGLFTLHLIERGAT